MLERVFSWDTLWWILVIIYVPACIGLIVIVLLQKGKGSGFAGSFGAGAGPGSETVFGPRTGQTLPVKLTYIAAVVFISISVIFSMVASKVGKGMAPELLEEDGATIVQVNPLDDLGIGMGKAGGADPIRPVASDAGQVDGAPVDSSTADVPE